MGSNPLVENDGDLSLLLFSCSSRADADAAIELASISALIIELNQTIAPHSPVARSPPPSLVCLPRTSPPHFHHFRRGLLLPAKLVTLRPKPSPPPVQAAFLPPSVVRTLHRSHWSSAADRRTYRGVASFEPAANGRGEGGRDGLHDTLPLTATASAARPQPQVRHKFSLSTLVC